VSDVSKPEVSGVAVTNDVSVTETVAEKSSAGQDTDQDGIPDEVEAKHGLNPADPKDALEDKDKDGFSNIAEFRSPGSKNTTDMSDPLSHPPLVNRLIVTKIWNDVIPMVIGKVEAYGDKKEAWSVLVKYAHPNGTRSDYFNIGQHLKLKDGLYLIKDVIPRKVKQFDKSVNSTVEVDKSTIVLKTPNGTQVYATVKGKVYDAGKSAQIIDAVSGKTFKVRRSEILVIGDETTGIEEYRVNKVDDKLNKVLLYSPSNKSLHTLKMKVSE